MADTTDNTTAGSAAPTTLRQLYLELVQPHAQVQNSINHLELLCARLNNVRTQMSQVRVNATPSSSMIDSLPPEVSQLRANAIPSASMIDSLPPEVSQLRPNTIPSSSMTDSLQTEVTEPKYANSALSTQVQALSKFHNFPELPIEIRRQIWGYALTEPQVHIFDCTSKTSTRSHLTDLMQSCREARQLGLELSTQYFEVSKDSSGTENKGNAGIKNYMTRYDTLYVTAENSSPGCHDAWTPLNVAFKCTQCGADAHDKPWTGGGLAEKTCDLHGIAVLAIDKALWDTCKDDVGVFSRLVNLILWYNHVPEVYIVSQASDSSRKIDQSVIFRTSPKRLQPYRPMVSEMFHRWNIQPNYTPPWLSQADCAERLLEEFKAHRAAGRRYIMQQQLPRVVLEKLELDDLSGWQTPKVRFVEINP